MFVKGFSSASNFNIIATFANPTITLEIIIPRGTAVNSLTLSVFVYSPIFSSTARSAFSSYHFVCNFHADFNNTPYLVKQNTNTSSTIYFLGGIISGLLANSFYFGHLVDDPPVLNNYNSLYLSSKQISETSIYSFINGTISANLFVSIQMYNTQCKNLSYPYLMMSNQRCYINCPAKTYADSDKRCNKCDQCDDITLCNYCYYSMCDDNEYYIH